MAFRNAREWIAEKDANLWTGLFLLILSGSVISEAFQLELGTPQNPGSGFMIFGAASVLGILALHQFIKSLCSQRRKVERPSEEIHWGRVVSIMLANVVYIFLLHPLGYLLSTFLLLSFLFQIQERGKWFSAVGGAALTSFLSYLIFSRILQLNLPRGLIPFF